ncbi:hypothetical protein [Sphingopyxis chilensis]
MEGMVMGAAIGLREDFDGATLRRLSRTTKSVSWVLAQIYNHAEKAERGTDDHARQDVRWRPGEVRIRTFAA